MSDPSEADHTAGAERLARKIHDQVATKYKTATAAYPQENEGSWWGKLTAAALATDRHRPAPGHEEQPLVKMLRTQVERLQRRVAELESELDNFREHPSVRFPTTGLASVERVASIELMTKQIHQVRIRNPMVPTTTCPQNQIFSLFTFAARSWHHGI